MPDSLDNQRRRVIANHIIDLAAFFARRGDGLDPARKINQAPLFGRNLGPIGDVDLVSADSEFAHRDPIAGLELLRRHDEHRPIGAVEHLQRHIIGSEYGTGDRAMAAEYDQVMSCGFL
jgi:hypothetical protein